MEHYLELRILQLSWMGLNVLVLFAILPDDLSLVLAYDVLS